MNDHRTQQLRQWLQVLEALVLASMANTVLNFVPVIPAGLTTWVSRGIMLAAAFSLWKLSQVEASYRKAAIFRALMLVCGVLGGALLNFAASVFSLVAAYREYHAHSGLVAELDADLAARWKNLFVWSLVVGVLAGLVTAATAVALSIAGSASAATVTATVMAIFVVPQLAVDWMYRSYLRRTRAFFEV